ncbi:uncharacterized protein LOC111240687 isoform X2 [Vigna radiata var. radiata]|uniref:Uncharacterized protein LOC111240687 isoform X2 n=1 Tax=Vigna radiata var. radiata TaxID=3916 RepID=A0A3Q0ENZ1_VIGRR|nr:uncharacterized protein LOC111240687 isoform X2 [Vigna radiata var. radiata]XP_022631942.1 uncharacterized protein LOC111240687 isoform X2 [Vigna radiata var. radiata]
MVILKKRYMFNNQQVSFKRVEKLKFTGCRKLYMDLSRPHELGIAKLKPTLPKKSLIDVPVNTHCSPNRYFLGIEVIQSKVGIFICQRRYAREILARFNMTKSNPVRNPIVPRTTLSRDEEGVPIDATKFKQAISSLMYLTVTRPDLMYGVSLISRYMANPKESHWAAIKRILRYLKSTIEYGIFYQQSGRTGLVAYSDSNYAGDLDD